MDISAEIIKALIPVRRKLWFSRGMVTKKAVSMLDNLTKLETRDTEDTNRRKKTREDISRWIEEERVQLLQGTETDVKNAWAVTKWASMNQNPRYDAENEWFSGWLGGGGESTKDENLPPPAVRPAYASSLMSALLDDDDGICGTGGDDGRRSRETSVPAEPSRSTWSRSVDIGVKLDLLLDVIEIQRRLYFSQGMVGAMLVILEQRRTGLPDQRMAQEMEDWVSQEILRLEGGTDEDRKSLTLVRKWAEDPLLPNSSYSWRGRMSLPSSAHDELHNRRRFLLETVGKITNIRADREDLQRICTAYVQEKASRGDIRPSYVSPTAARTTSNETRKRDGAAGKKRASSGNYKPPTADDVADEYEAARPKKRQSTGSVKERNTQTGTAAAPATVASNAANTTAKVPNVGFNFQKANTQPMSTEDLFRALFGGSTGGDGGGVSGVEETSPDQKVQCAQQ